MVFAIDEPGRSSQNQRHVSYQGKHMLRSIFSGLAFLTLFAFSAASARAHFIWLELAPAGGGREARLYFGEEAAQGEAHLLGKVAHAKAWVRTPAGEPAEVKLARAGDDAEALVAPCPAATAASLEGTCDYGIYERGPGVLLQYYAKALAGDWTTHPELARAERLKLDIVPTAAGGKLAALVLYEGRPVAAEEVVVVGPDGNAHELKTDAAGKVEIDAAAGRYAIRAGHIEAARSGERDGKKYAQTWHYATLVLDVPKQSVAAAASDSAEDALKRARDGRSVWQDFPGFTSQLVIRGGGEEVQGQLTIDADGVVSLEAPISKLSEWAEEQLNSLVQHRMPGGEVTTGQVAWADDDADNPLGRKITLGDPEMKSAYRLKDDVIMEVNRSMGPTRFTISVLQIERDADGKYLPKSFVMNFFNSATGELQNSLGYLNDWQRVGPFDLPTRIVEVDAKKGGSTTKEIVFANSRLIEKK
jgi:uncharacterized GH25 family protein